MYDFVMLLAVDIESAGGGKDRAFFTPLTIANFLARWAIHGNARARVLDPTCGEGVFLLAAACQLRDAGAAPSGPLVDGAASG